MTGPPAGDAADPAEEQMAKTIISADSHITEPPGCYVDNIDPKYRENRAENSAR